MSVVIDANALVAFVTNEQTADAIGRLMKDWASSEVPLHAPILARYEVANAFTKKHASGGLGDIREPQLVRRFTREPSGHEIARRRLVVRWSTAPALRTETL